MEGSRSRTTRRVPRKEAPTHAAWKPLGRLTCCAPGNTFLHSIKSRSASHMRASELTSDAAARSPRRHEVGRLVLVKATPGRSAVRDSNAGHTFGLTLEVTGRWVVPVPSWKTGSKNHPTETLVHAPSRSPIRPNLRPPNQHS